MPKFSGIYMTINIHLCMTISSYYFTVMDNSEIKWDQN